MSYSAPKGKRRKMLSFKLGEISGVVRPAQEGALAGIVKTDNLVPIVKFGMPGEVTAPATMTKATDGHTHLVHCADAPHGETGYGKSAGSSDYGHSHPWIRDPETGVIKLGEMLGHTHEIEGVGKAAPAPHVPVNTPRIEENAMDKDQEIAKLKLETARLAGELAKALLAAQLTDADKAYAKTLGEAQRELFIAKTAPERAAITKAAFEVVYKDADGNEYTALDDKRIVDSAKRSDAALKRADDAEAKERATAMAKRASEELAAWPGTDDDKAWLLLVVDKAALAEASAKDATDVAKGRAKRIGEMFSAAENALKGVFEAPTEIVDGGEEGEGAERTTKAAPRLAGDTLGIAKNAAAQKFDRLVREEMAKSKCDEPKATVAVMATREGSQLYKAGYPDVA